MPNEIQNNRLQQKLDELTEPALFDSNSSQALWNKLEVRLQPKKKRRTMLLYYAAACLLILLTIGFLLQYAAGKKENTIVHNVTDKLPGLQKQAAAIEKAAGITENIFPAKKINAADKNVSPVAKTKRIDLLKVMINNRPANTNYPTPAVDSNILKSAVTVPGSPVAATVAAAPAKPKLKVLHVNEIMYEGEMRAREERNNRNAKWMFAGSNTYRNKLMEEGAPDNDTKKKSLFTIPLQKSTNN